jgi:aspartate aminotransferase
MASIVGHVGAWAPRAEQIATAKILGRRDVIEAYHREMKGEVYARLEALYDGLMALRERGHAVEAVRPMGAIYLTVRFPLHGAVTPDGDELRTNEEIRHYLLSAAGMAVVPFQAFGLMEETGWFRLSVGAVSKEEIPAVLQRLDGALSALRSGVTQAAA